jgi:hypothetical protein
MPDPCDHALGRATGSPPRLLDGVAISAAGVAAAAAALHLTGAEAILSALVALAVEGVLERVHGRLEHRPAQILEPLFCERAAAVLVAGLLMGGQSVA